MIRISAKYFYRFKIAATIVITGITYLIIYEVLHEMGHGLIGIIGGGHITNLHLGFDAHIVIRGTNFNRFTLSIMNIMGMLLPYLIFCIVTLGYNKNNNNKIYVLFHGISAMGISSSLLPWVFLPLASILSYSPTSDDVIKFLQNSQIPPALVSLMAIVLLGIFLLIVYLKAIIKNFSTLIVEMDARK